MCQYVAVCESPGGTEYCVLSLFGCLYGSQVGLRSAKRIFRPW